MRLLHPETINIITYMCTDEDFKHATVSRKQVISHAWSEVLKYLATNKPHPKMFIENKQHLGVYMNMIKEHGDFVGCNLNVEHLLKYDDVYIGFTVGYDSWEVLDRYYDRDYLFSDAVSLYLKGVNIFQYIYGTQWRKYVPIENLKEIQRVVNKTMTKKTKGE